MFSEGYRHHGRSFEQTYRCYPVLFIDKPQPEVGDKIIMPPSALDQLASLSIDYPMLFEIYNAATERISHCGVLEFTAEEGIVYMPYWMMENMLLQEGSTVQVKNVTLPKGRYVRLQPHTKDFFDISNPKAILETTLRNFSCLTTGDTIMVDYNNKKYYIDIIETKPSTAISIIETDCEVDFVPALDYRAPERSTSIPSSRALAQVQEKQPEAQPRFIPFTGTGRLLGGKPLTNFASPVTSSTPKPNQPVENGLQSKGPISQRITGQPSEKLMFGSNLSRTPKETEKVDNKQTKREPRKKQEPKFQAFSGKKYSLRG